MAEPDDVEEDLFADLYEADENHAPKKTAVSATAQPASSDTVMKTSETPGYGEEPEVAFDPTSFDTEPQGQDEPTNGTHSPKQAQEMQEKPPQPEVYNVNMKEDG
ncbi:uncharacterized protein Z519_05932 [Cladophialophora bantiana CBS 173.52]|uniref:Uncharacterized protein n=1 Tax=Cladophialophora bantiana (strain ATCC 10958 / CBS 173.52 / CDC B-1940 / NIH 8579) TaxID=1442370 RepID=A0A0D2G3S9_CLAB1|nr:uncharacterized protein Z519_05932 [Cladophialophora bantiana CBS 173.52]KIW93327.1 hypothetical protein Z519_05932 [Cladophialophora bantiana CBS 173.52]